VENPAQIGIDHEVADLEAIRQHFGQEQVSLIGWSYLGGVVARYAMAYPERVGRLVQVSPMRPYHAIRAPRRLNYSTHVSVVIKRLDGVGVDKSDLAAYECRLWFEVRVAPYILVDPASVDRVTWPCDLPNERPEHFYEWPDYFDKQIEDLLGPSNDWDWRAEAASLEAPTLVIHGERDAVPLEGSRTWAARPNARLLVIEGAGHASFVEKPEVFFPAVDRFLKGEWLEDAQTVGD
jgi:proline iminopeptidase